MTKLTVTFCNFANASKETVVHLNANHSYVRSPFLTLRPRHLLVTNNHITSSAAFNSGFMQTNPCHVESKHSAEHIGYETQALIFRNTNMVAQFLANLVVFVRKFARNLTAASSHLTIAGCGSSVGPSLHGISEHWVV